ncbi:hypothetical protein R3I94_001344 [Phoxinus phoxinus]
MIRRDLEHGRIQTFPFKV